MIRKSVCITLLLAISCSVNALGFRGIVVNSGLNEPLDARIELLSVDPAEIDRLGVSLADEAAFGKAGLERSAALTGLRFEPKVGRRGEVYVQITSRNGLREPFLNFLLEVNWQGTVLLREYAILLDPRDTGPVTVTAASGARPRDNSQASGQSNRSAQHYGPVRPAETLWVVAQRTRPDKSVTVEQMMMALQRRNPDAFRRGNVNLLKQGVTLEIPDRESITRLSPDQARAAFLLQNEEWRSAGKLTSATSSSGAEVNRRADATVPANTETESNAQAVSEPAANQPNLRVLEPEPEAVPGAGAKLMQEPSAEEMRLREEIADARHDLAAVREINRDLSELKDALTEKLQALRNSLDERDRTIDLLEKRLRGVVNGSKPATDSGGTGGPMAGKSEVPGGISSQLEVAREQVEKEPAVGESSQRGSATTDLSWFIEHWLPLLVVALVMLMLLLIAVVRRRQTKNGLPDPDAFSSYIDMPDRFESEYDSEDETVPSQVSKEEYAPPREREGDFSPIAGADVASALTEADIYLAYRRYSQAENLVKEAIASHPDNMILRAKLLEIYAFREDRRMFTGAMEEAYAKMSASEPEIWAKVVEMGRNLIPEHRLIAGTLLPEEQSEAVAADFPVDLADLDRTPSGDSRATGKDS